MKKKELDFFKKLLEDERIKISRHLELLSGVTTEEKDATSGDSVDIAAHEIDKANTQKICKREKYLLKKIDLALVKIKEGTYGECEMCGEPIARARLEARPVAQLCIDCKTEQETQERKFSSREIEAGDDDGIDEGDEG
jgi:DnaK suppressor protein